MLDSISFRCILTKLLQAWSLDQNWVRPMDHKFIPTSTCMYDVEKNDGVLNRFTKCDKNFAEVISAIVLKCFV